MSTCLLIKLNTQDILSIKPNEHGRVLIKPNAHVHANGHDIIYIWSSQPSRTCFPERNPTSRCPNRSARVNERFIKQPRVPSSNMTHEMIIPMTDAITTTTTTRIAIKAIMIPPQAT